MEGDDSLRAELSLRLAKAQRDLVRVEHDLEVARGQVALQRSNATEAQAVTKLLRAAVRAAEANLAPMKLLIEVLRRNGGGEVEWRELEGTVTRVLGLLDAAVRERVG